ncbi:MAG: aminoacyltransferase [Clostridium sp.]|nr:MAG: aminoacyltransferase [Clostridium sp.]
MNLKIFAYNHPLRSYAQTVNYAKLMGEMGFSYDYIGYKDDMDNIVAGSLVLTKKD